MISKRSLKFFMIAFSALFFVSNTLVHAAVYSIPHVDVYAKSLATRQVVAGTTSDDGSFKITVPESAGAFNIFIQDQNMPPIKLIAKSGVVSGRVVVLTDQTTTTEPTNKPTPAIAPVKKASAPISIKVPVAVPQPATKNNVPPLLRPLPVFPVVH